LNKPQSGLFAGQSPAIRQNHRILTNSAIDAMRLAGKACHAFPEVQGF
jgi:hypothetical protein